MKGARSNPGGGTVCRCPFAAAAAAVSLAAALNAAAFIAAPAAFAQDERPAPEATSQPAATQPAAAPATQPALDGDVYKVSRFNIEYRGAARATEGDQGDPRPTVQELLDHVNVALGVLPDGSMVAPPKLEEAWRRNRGMDVPLDKDGKFHPRPIETVTTHLSDVSKERDYHASAIWAIDEQLRRRFTDDPKLHLLGVYVVPSPNDFVEEGQNEARHLVNKRGDRTDATLWVFTGKVIQVRTIASGKRITDPSKRTDNDLHKWIRDHSPVQAAAATTQPTTGAKPAERTDLLLKDKLDDYVSFLNRQPGRHVDVAISGVQTGSSGDVSLDYLVTETRPWSAYFQISNTGTKETDPWRERFGYVNNQLFKRDDTFSVDYTTAAFNTSQDVAVSYDTPISPNRKLRARVYGDYDQFTASDVGVALERFNGEQYSGGAELVYNFFQRGNAFVDAVAGARYEHVFVRNNTVNVNTSGSADFAVPYVGFRYEQVTDIASTTADVTLSGRFTNATLAERNKLGRLDTDQDVMVLQGGVAESVYLEPIFDSRFYAGESTLAHELAFSLRGQYAFNGRLIPQAEEVAGGLYSVRGYPESVSAGDSVIIGSAEYRFHIPRSFTPADVRAAHEQEVARKKSESAKQPLQPPGTSAPPPSTGAPLDATRRSSTATNLAGTQFRWIPQQAYGRPDWDLIARAFVDAGFVYNSSEQAFEHNDTLVGTGLGLELDVQLQHLQNLSVRVDWGVPLNALPGGPSVGDSRFHISATLMY